MKNTHRTVWAVVALLLGGTSAYAQLSFPTLSEDARLFSPSQTVGTARVQGFGGAGFSLGGDISASALNPAGLGFYNRSSIAVTPFFRGIETNTNLGGVASENNYLGDYGVASFGIVFSKPKDNVVPSRFRGGSFAVTFNQTNTYSFTNTFGGNTTDFSFIDDVSGRAGGINVATLDAELEQNPPQIPDYIAAAYDNFLINAVFDENGVHDGTYVASLPPGVLAQPIGTSETSGRMNQWNFSYGGNFDNKLYVGGSIGLMSFRQERQNLYRESYIYPQEYDNFLNEDNFFFPAANNPLSIDYVDDIQLTEVQEVIGTGVNANLGIIYRPIEALTVGVSFLTPTIFGVEELNYFDFTSNIRGLQLSDSSDFLEQVNPLSRGNEGLLSYNLKTPARLGVGASYFFEKYGFLTADVEYVRYPGYRFSSSDNAVSDIMSGTNREVEEIYQSTVNYRLGGEFRYSVLRLRLGYAMFMDPTDFQDDTLNRNRQSISGGVGVITSSFFADLAVISSQFDTDARPYGGADFYSQTNNLTNVLLTLGFNF
ncbi:MAG: hypothetical protein WA958_00205 [Tunicatimonas sp.]